VLRTQVREAVRGQILDAAEELIAARGLHGAPLAQIAKRAGVAVGTLYNYFTDRDAMVRALFETRRSTLRPLLHAAAAAAEHLPFEMRLRQFLRDVLQAFELHRRFIRVFIEAEHLRVTPNTAPSDLQNLLATIIEAGVSERVIYADTAARLPVMIVGSIKAVVLRHVVDGTSFELEDEAIVSVFLDGARRRR
jgi:AcrR family transcriptional regulator